MEILRSLADEVWANSGQTRAAPEPLLELQVFGWNLGGAPLEDLPQAFRDCTAAPLGEKIALLQECPRLDKGWRTSKEQGLSILQHRSEQQWRGVGIMFHSDTWAVISKKSSGRGIWVRMKHLASSQFLWVGSLYLPPGLTQAECQSTLGEFQSLLPKGSIRAVFSGDTNAAYSWAPADTGDVPFGQDGKGVLLLDSLFQQGFRTLAPSRAQQGVATSRPRQEGKKGNRIDLIASKGL